MNNNFAAELLHGLSANVVRVMRDVEAQQTVRPKASLHTRLGSRKIALTDLAGTIQSDVETVLIVEDINITWMEAVGKNLNVKPSFFVEHAQEIKSFEPWSAIMGGTPTQTTQEFRDQLYSSVQTAGQAHYWHLNGLILVDALATEAPLILHLPLSNNRGGLVVPQLYNQHRSLYECVDRFLSHTWHFNVLFSNHGISPMSFGYLLATSTWQTNLRKLDTVAKHVGFEEIRKPTVEINNKLHDLRRDLDILCKEVSRTREWIPKKVQQELGRFKEQTSEYVTSLDGALEQVLEEAKALEKFLMNSFTLLLSSISVQEAEESAKLSKRAQQLTLTLNPLAFVYVPLSFVTGIFGMNISEINGSLVSAWVPLATLGVTLSLTAVAAAVFYFSQPKKQR